MRKRERESGREIESVEWQTCTNRLIPSLPLKAYPLLRIKDLFRHMPFKPVPLKWIIFAIGFSYEVIHVGEVVPSLILVLWHNWTRQTNLFLLWSHYFSLLFPFLSLQFYLWYVSCCCVALFHILIKDSLLIFPNNKCIAFIIVPLYLCVITLL